MRKFSKIEKTMIIFAGDNYQAYDCKSHGLFLNRDENVSKSCPYNCGEEVKSLGSVSELRSKIVEGLK